MFKLVVLFALLAVSFALPSYLENSGLVYSTPIVREHSLEKVGAVIKSLPTAVSYQSSTIVHNSSPIVAPIVAPVVKIYAGAPIVKAVRSPLIQSYAVDPWTLAASSRLGYSALPFTYSGPLRYASGW